MRPLEPPLEATEPSAAMEELLERARRLVVDTIAALTEGHDAEAIAHIPDVLRAYGWLWAELAELRRPLEAEEGELLLQLLAAIGGRVKAEGEQAATPEARAELCWQVPVLLRRLRERGGELPHWLPPFEEQMTRTGALLWRDLHRARPEQAEARPRALTLLLRLCELHQPPKAWVVGFAKELLEEEVTQEEVAASSAGGHLDEGRQEELRRWGEQLARVEPLEPELRRRLAALVIPAARPPQPNPVDLEARIRQSVEHWLEQNPGGGVPAELRLVCVPGARPVPHDRQRLELNLAPLLELNDLEALDRLVQAFFEPLRAQGRGADFTLREPTSSLYESLGLLWLQGEELSAAAFSRLAYATAAWNRCGGPGALGSRLLGSSLRMAELREGVSVLRPEAVELAALQSVLHRHRELEPALAAIRRHHLLPAWMERRREAWWFDPSDTEENLCRLHLEAGFYASSHAPLECLERWSQAVLAALLQGQVAGTAASTGFYAVAQRLFGQTGRVPELVQWPGDPAIYGFWAGKEVVLATTHAAELEAHHRSGQAFQLFSDLRISPYGLRCVQAPLSRYPNRPAGGFGESLDACLEQIDALHRQRPFRVFVAACGVYGLPLCEAVQRRYGVSCLCSGDRMNAYFGLEQAATADWRADGRIREHWLSPAA